MANSLLKGLRVFLKAAPGIMLFMIVAGCGKGGAELAGVWDNVKAPEAVEFKKNGTGVFSYPNNLNPPLAFTWKKTAKNSCYLDVDYMGGKRTLTGTLKDKTLTLESAAGKEEYIKRTAR